MRLILIPVFGALCVAQPPTPAGGKWTHAVALDALTGARSESFQLVSDNEVGDGIAKGPASFLVICSGGSKPHWIASALTSPTVLDSADSRSPLTDIGQQTVYLRTDDKIHIHAWNISDDFKTLWVDHGATEQFIESRLARIQFGLFVGTPAVALFTTAGIDRQMLESTCGPWKKKKGKR